LIISHRRCYYFWKADSSLANSAAKKTFAKVVSIEKACEKHGVNTTEFLEKLNRKNFKTKAPYENETTNPGREISREEKCQADTWVGSLLKAYPTTKKVFESHYGEGCFSCRGQTFETVE
jgi:hypothetical protein